MSERAEFAPEDTHKHMRLAIISNVSGYPWAGSESLWHLAAMQALQAGHEVTALLHPDLMAAAPIAAFRAAGGVVQKWQPFPIARFQNLKEKIRPSFPVGQFRRFDAILVSLGSLPSINYVPGLVAGLCRAGTPYVLLCQFNADHLMISPSERAAVSAVMHGSTACVFVSRRNLLEARRQFAMEPPRAQLVLNPVRSPLEKPWPWPAASAKISFASVARFETAWKGQDLLLDVLGQPAWRERDWQLRFYGSGPDLEYVRKLTAFLALEDRVFFEGFVDNLANVWTKNQLLLMPSHGEGTPLAALEAMMYGRPVVATDVGGNAEIIQDGVTGFIAEAATVRSFSNALERAWQQQSQWREMGLAAHKYIIERTRQELAPAKALLKTWTAAAAK
jgi:glycosyltransferase involved in cell wall biosynthesis